MKRVAVVDIGSNSTRLFIADVDAGGATQIERRTNVTRLADGVDQTGRLSDEAMSRVDSVLADYRKLIDEHHAETTIGLLTSAVRDASNGEAFVAELRERFALSARVLDGTEEARLTYTGATFERPPAEPTLVIDIGGGSTELVVGNGREIAFHASLQAGVVRHTERHIASDPPTPKELEALAADVRALIESAVDVEPLAKARAGIAVAGTPTSLASIELGLEPYDPAQVHGRTLALRSIQRLLSQLASAPLAKRAEIPGLHPDRAQSIVAGVVILVEAMRAFELEEIEVSEHDILYGVAIGALSALECG